jgi:hypothetical protein
MRLVVFGVGRGKASDGRFEFIERRLEDPEVGETPTVFGHAAIVLWSWLALANPYTLDQLANAAHLFGISSYHVLRVVGDLPLKKPHQAGHG